MPSAWNLDKVQAAHEAAKVAPPQLSRVRVGVALVFAWNVLAVAAPAMDSEALLKELGALKAQQQQASGQRLVRLAAQILEASRTDAAALRMFVAATHDTEFNARAKDAGRFQDWKRDPRGLLSEKPFLAALRFHLRYLALSLREASRPAGEGLPPIKELTDYVADFVSAQAEFGSEWQRDDRPDTRDLLENPVADGRVAWANFVGEPLAKLSEDGEHWEPAPGKWREILERDVRAPLRAKKDPRLLETWTLQIQAEAKLLARNRGEVANLDFVQVDSPRLQWGQARDFLALGRQAEGVAAMVKLVRQHPQHPDLAAWVDELTALLKPNAAPAPAPGGK